MKKSKINKSLNTLRHSENTFYSIFENSLNAILLGHPSGAILDANLEVLKMFGYTLEEMKSSGRQLLFDHTDPVLIEGLKTREIEGKIKCELIGIRKNGERFPCEVSSIIFKIDTGEIRTSTILNDISWRKKAEEEMRLLIDNTEESFILLNKTLHILAFNKSYSDRYKKLLNKEVKKGDFILDYAQPERKKEVEAIYQRVLNGEIVNDEITITSSNKQKRIFSINYKPAKNNQNEIIGAFITTSDITEERLAQEKLKTAELRFRSIIEHSNDLIILVDSNGKIKYISPSMEKFLGLKLHDVIDKYYKFIIHTDDREESKQILEKLLKNPGVPISRTVRFLNKYGNSIWVEGIITNLLEDENVRAIVSNYRDISDKINSNMLKEFERRDKEALINSTDDLIWSVSKDFKLIAGNKSFINVMKASTGLNLKGGDNLLMDGFYDQDYLALWKELYEFALKGNSFKKEILTIINKRETWSETSFTPIFYKNSVEGIACYLRDITERKLKDEKIKESQERYDIIAKATNDTVRDMDLKSDKIKWNKGIHGIFGYSKDDTEFDINWWYDKIHPKDVNRIKESISSKLETRQTRWEEEYRFRCMDKSYKHVFERDFLVVNDQNEPIRVISSMQDITVQKREEHRLKLLESVITNTTDAVMITEAEPFDEPGPRIIFVNEAFTKMTGYHFSEVFGKSPRILQGPNTSRKELNKMSKAMRKWKSCEITVINYKKNGEEFWINFSITPVADETGWYTHWIAIEKDVTQIKLAELEKEHIIAELSQNNNDLKQFSYVTSHNLRAPISTLLGLTSLLEQYDIQDKSLIKILDGIKHSALMFDETVKDLANVLLIKDKKNIIVESISLLSVLSKVRKQLNLEDNSEVSIQYDFKTDPVIKFTNAYLESILLNLFTNAIKYQSPNRKLDISISLHKTTGFKVLKFSDNGIGIDTELYKDKLFKLFQRFHDQSEGKGLGLYIIRSQLEALGGTIVIESEINVGTTFTLIIRD